MFYCIWWPESHFPQPGRGRIIIHSANYRSKNKSQRYYNIHWVIIVIVSKSLYLPFLEGLSDKGNIRYTLKALFPFFILLSLTSSISGKEFMAHRKFAFHVFGSGLSTPGWYFPNKIAQRIKVNKKRKKIKIQNKTFWKHRITGQVVERTIVIPGYTYND